MELPESQTVAGWLAVAFAALASAFGIRRLHSRGNVDAAKDSNEIGLFKSVLQERDAYKEDASKAWRMREQDVREIAALRGREEQLTQELAALRREFDRLRRIVIRRLPELAEFFSSELGPLDDTIPPVI